MGAQGGEPGASCVCVEVGEGTACLHALAFWVGEESLRSLALGSQQALRAMTNSDLGGQVPRVGGRPCPCTATQLPGPGLSIFQVHSLQEGRQGAQAQPKGDHYEDPRARRQGGP